MADDLVVFGVASDGSTEQWDGHRTPVGVLLRWFIRPDLGYPDYGFDVYRAAVPDTPVLPFDDLNAPFVEGRTAWDTGLVTVSCPTGLHFLRSSQPGRWRLVVTPTSPVTISFSSPAWLAEVRTDAGTTGLEVAGLTGGVQRRRETLAAPGAAVRWRTRGVQVLELTGTGTVSSIGYHLLGDPASWTHLAHRCLPVVDPGYRCAPVAVSEAAEARSRLPGPVAAEWAARFDAAFTALLPALRRLATRAAAAAVPAPTPPDEGRLGVDERALIDLAALDPHGARMLGLGYDDPLGGALDRREYTYKVVGQWADRPVAIERRGIDLVTLAGRLKIRVVRSGSGNTPKKPGLLTIEFEHAVRDASLRLEVSDPVSWSATASDGSSSTGTLTGGVPRLDFASLVTLTMDWASGRDPVLLGVGWTPVVERFGLLTGVVAAEPPPPAGPPSVAVAVVHADSPSALAVAQLDWDVPAAADGVLPETAAVAYQIGHRHLLSDPAAPTPVPAGPVHRDLLYDAAAVYLAEAAVAKVRPRTLHVDRVGGAGLSPGWWGWWARGVDLFGRVSAPTPWTLRVVLDSAPPPAPILVAAEYVQAGMPAAAGVGRSAEARRWLSTHPGVDALVVSWAFGPDEARVSPDADGFRLLVRHPAPVAGAPAGSALVYPEPWASGAPPAGRGSAGVVAQFGPVSQLSAGMVTATAADPVLEVTVTQVLAVSAPSPVPLTGQSAAAQPRSVCRLDLDLDTGSGVFVGGTLTVSGVDYTVVGNGEGEAVDVVVEHAATVTLVPGPALLRAAKGTLLSVATTAAALASGSGLRPRSGVIVTGSGVAEGRFRVLRAVAGAFLCRAEGPLPVVGDMVEWYPVWTAAIADTGFGPAATEAAPVAHAQVAVRAVRRLAGTAIESVPSAPGTVTAVDLTRPNTPTVTAIGYDSGKRCAELASRADWYGRSRFSFDWVAQTGRRYVVYRALSEEVCRLDLAEHDHDGRNHAFPIAADWPPGVFADTARRQAVLADLAALDAARALTGLTARRDAVAAAYAALRCDAQMLLARQAYAWPAFVALTAEPTSATSHQDVLDGRTRGHWLYRVVARTNAGVESAPSEPTPPICCPDVVPPAVPVVHSALADPAGGAVTLRWLASPDADLHHYDIYAARHPDAVADLDDLTPAATHTPAQHQPGTVINLPVEVSPGDWSFWIRAVDTAGNRSAPSRMLRGRPIVPPPSPPVWTAATRTASGVALSWTHPGDATHRGDAHLSCQVERRPAGAGAWFAVSPWLPRGRYSYADTPPDVAQAWDYRICVRDHHGQTAAALPTLTLPQVP
ncbi:hypothetical protein [Frankia sp. Cppng1_Ct_nod]|uniref:hypothetical protein n=1 Tax=Frankia sp. Cppng1_Ct_nod TaxID=2897162 RepID=UPI0020251CA6|nr:hypothetical protein [Frankia sp. Cppng1_Ct_nod]